MKGERGDGSFLSNIPTHPIARVTPILSLPPSLQVHRLGTSAGGDITPGGASPTAHCAERPAVPRAWKGN